MGVREYVVKEKKISKELKFNKKELVKELDRQLNNRGYKHLELTYSEKNTPGGLKVNFKWGAEKKISETEKLALDINFETISKKVKVEKDGKKKTMDEGTVNISLVGFTKKDSEDEWSLKKEKISKRVLREAYEKFVRGKKNKYYVDEVEKDIDAIIDGLKKYLKMNK